MNLEISPDLEAYICYAVVLAAGLLAAVQQVRARLPARSAWRLLETYLLFLAYVGVPVVLFWFLDRTGAINDTSLFAAILIGFGYERILTGGLDKIQLPGEISRLWQPFVAWADRVANRVSTHLRRHRERFEESLFTAIVADPSKFDALSTLSHEVAVDPAVLDAELKKVEVPNLGQGVIKRKKVRLLYNEIARVPEGPYLLKQRKVVRPWDYYWFVFDLRSVLTISGFILLLVGSSVFMSVLLYRTQRVGYYVWRLEKRNASQLDQFRNREHIAAELDGAARNAARNRLIRSLSKPGVSVERADLMVGLLVEKRLAGEDFDTEVVDQLIDAIRSCSVDVRTRIHEALRFMFRDRQRKKAAQPPATLPTELDKWVPSQGDSATRLEEYVYLWRSAMGLERSAK